MNNFEDQLEIRALLERYCDGVNQRDAEIWGSTWANDAVWELPHLAKNNTNIRVNTIHPGVIGTPLIEGAINGAPDPLAARSMLEGIAPMGRLGQMEEVVNLLLYLGSDESRFMTGSELVIDGGSTAGLPGV